MKKQRPVIEYDSSIIAEAEANKARQAQYQTQAGRLYSLAARAIDTIESALDSEDEKIRLSAAGMLLRAVKLHELGPPDGETRPQAIANDRALAGLIAGM